MQRRFRVLVTGAGGQLGRALLGASRPDWIDLVGMSRRELDVRSAADVDGAMAAGRYDAIVNAAAYTAVDRAETDRRNAFAVNHGGALNTAAACARSGAILIHVSTDYVFDGIKPTPYTERDPVSPLGVYGHSKAAGEVAVRSRLATHIILRTAWLFSAGENNFVRKILKLAAERDELSIVADQHGNPTAATDLASVILDLLDRVLLNRDVDDGAPWGTYHCVNAGGATWQELAEEAINRGLGRFGRRPAIRPITTAQYPTAARRPANSRLDCTKLETTFGIRLRPWREALDRVVAEILEEAHS